MAEQEFSEFVRRKTAVVQSESGEGIDWSKRRADWLRELDELYARMQGHLTPYTEAGEIQIERTPIQLREDHLGTYDAHKLTFKIGCEKIVAKPIGTLLIGARGRADLSGSRKTLKIVLLDKGGPVLTTKIEHGGVTEESSRSESSTGVSSVEGRTPHVVRSGMSANSAPAAAGVRAYA